MIVLPSVKYSKKEIKIRKDFNEQMKITEELLQLYEVRRNKAKEIVDLTEQIKVIKETQLKEFEGVPRFLKQVSCPCGGVYNQNTFKQHIKGKKHRLYECEFD